MSFRTGRLALPVLAALVAGCADAPPPEFVSKSDKFAVRFRGAPQVRERPVGGSRSVVYKIESPDGAETVAVTELPLKGDEPPEMAPWLLNSAKADLIRESGGTLTADASSALAGKYPGREFAARVTDPHPGVLRARVYFARGRLYQVVVMGTAEYASAPAATAFLESFRLTE